MPIRPIRSASGWGRSTVIRGSGRVVRQFVAYAAPWEPIPDDGIALLPGKQLPHTALTPRAPAAHDGFSVQEPQVAERPVDDLRLADDVSSGTKGSGIHSWESHDPPRLSPSTSSGLGGTSRSAGPASPLRRVGQRLVDDRRRRR